MNRLLLAAALVLTLPAFAQQGGTTFKDTSMLRAPAGAKVAIFEFEDLECPACARAFPIVHEAVQKYKIPLLRHDFPLKMHVWSFDAAVIARYIQDKISPETAEEYRRTVFANQTAIATKDDLNAFTQKYFQTHGRQMPFVIDPSGRFTAEVQSDETLGERVGLTQTPTIFIVTQKDFVQVTDVTQLYQMLDAEIAKAGSAASKTTHTAHK